MWPPSCWWTFRKCLNCAALLTENQKRTEHLISQNHGWLKYSKTPRAPGKNQFLNQEWSLGFLHSLQGSKVTQGEFVVMILWRIERMTVGRKTRSAFYLTDISVQWGDFLLKKNTHSPSHVSSIPTLFHHTCPVSLSVNDATTHWATASCNLLKYTERPTVLVL